MKRITFLMVLILSAGMVFAQVNKNQAKKIKKAPTVKIDAAKVPQAVKDAQTKKFSGISEIKWKMKLIKKQEQTMNSYSAHFKQNGMKTIAHYKPDGTAVAVISHISLQNVPQTIVSTVANNYPGFKPKLAVKIEVLSKSITQYRLTLLKPAAKLILYVDETGNDAQKANIGKEVMGEDESGVEESEDDN